MIQSNQFYLVKTIIFILFFFLFVGIQAQQNDSLASLKKRQKKVIIAGLAGTTLVHTGLYQLWYKDYPSSKFHFINDNKEWNQMDKCGHGFSAYYLSVVGTEAAKWSGMSRKKAIWLGGAFGMIFQHPIEIFDGFSSGWGASLGDIAANTLGSGLCISQNLLWNEQRIGLKYSFTQSVYAPIRPNVLGKDITQQFLKDYNGQTYWLSFNISSFMKNKESKFPKWLNFSFGYGSNGLIGGFKNEWTDKKTGITYQRFDVPRYRQYYFSPDIDLNRIKTKSKGLKLALKLLNCIKIPMPTFEYNSLRNSKFHWLKF